MSECAQCGQSSVAESDGVVFIVLSMSSLHCFHVIVAMPIVYRFKVVIVLLFRY